MSKNGEHFILPIADGTVTLSVRDQVFRRTQRRFFKESRTGLSRETRQRTTGNKNYRHHVEPIVQLYVPKEESFPIPLEYIDVVRRTNTT